MKVTSIPLSVFVDLSRAFDTVHHKILISKLENYGIRGKNELWFISYLTNRTQLIKYNNLNNSFQKIICGVPQGSVVLSTIGSLLFLIYVNNLKDEKFRFDYVCWRDTFFYSHIDIKDLFCNVNLELEKIRQWFNPFRTAKAATNGNHRLCLKLKPQVKCHWSLPAG